MFFSSSPPVGKTENIVWVDVASFQTTQLQNFESALVLGKYCGVGKRRIEKSFPGFDHLSEKI